MKHRMDSTANASGPQENGQQVTNDQCRALATSYKTDICGCVAQRVSITGLSG
jgi:hypothetical protein